MDLMVPHLHFPPALHCTPQLLAVDWWVLLKPHPSLPVQLFSVFVFSLCHLLFLSSASIWMEIKHREEFPWLHLFKKKTILSASDLHCCPLLVIRSLIALEDHRGCLTIRLSQTRSSSFNLWYTLLLSNTL